MSQFISGRIAHYKLGKRRNGRMSVRVLKRIQMKLLFFKRHLSVTLIFKFDFNTTEITSSKAHVCISLLQNFIYRFFNRNGVMTTMQTLHNRTEKSNKTEKVGT